MGQTVDRHNTVISKGWICYPCVLYLNKRTVNSLGVLSTSIGMTTHSMRDLAVKKSQYNNDFEIQISCTTWYDYFFFEITWYDYLDGD